MSDNPNLIPPRRQGGPKRMHELGYTVNTPKEDGTEIVLGSWKPEELVDLPEIAEAPQASEEVFGKPGTKSNLAAAVDGKYSEDNLPRQFDLPKAAPKIIPPRSQDGSIPGEARKHVPGKVITNVTEENEPSKLDLKSQGHSVPQDYDDPPPELHGFERLDLVSGPVPYAHLPEFKNGVFVRPLNPIDAARISRAVRSKSLTALLDALSHTVNVPYRYLAIADHEQIMYWHLLNSYPIEPFNVHWFSMYTRERITTTVRQPIVTETKLRITEKQFAEYRAKGLDIPRVMSLDLGDTISQMPVDEPGAHEDPVKEREAKVAREYKDDLLYLLYYIQYIDVTNKAVRAKIREHKDTVQPRLRGLMAYFETLKNLNIFQDVDNLSELISNYGITESFQAAAAREMTVIPALRALEDYLLAYPDTPRPVAAEISRLQDILINTPEDQRETATFEPVKEETTVPRNPWSFFSFVR